MAHPYPEHIDGFSYRGKYVYSLNFTTIARTTKFDDRDVVDLVSAQILRAGLEQRFEITAYCFMPDHVHLIVKGQDDGAEFKKFTKAAKQYSGYYYKQEKHTKLWDRYGYEHVLRDDAEFKAALRYLLENPVKAGLAKCPADYPFIGSSSYSVDQLLAQSGLFEETPPQ